jgi:hypothetical protein
MSSAALAVALGLLPAAAALDAVLVREARPDKPAVAHGHQR